MGNNPSYFKGGKRPVEKVSWHDATKFCQKLSSKTGKIYTLPSESQWKYACRAGTTAPFYFGETITPELVNYSGNYPYANAPKGKYGGETTDVGSFPPNAFGLYDIHGNVWEWCLDACHDNYNGAPTDGSSWESGGDSNDRLLRGGCWIHNSKFAGVPGATISMPTTSPTIGVFESSPLPRWFLAFIPSILPLFTFPLSPFFLLSFFLF